MADGVAEVQAGAHTALALVLLHDLFLEFQAAVDDLLDVFLGMLALKQRKELRVPDQAGFQCLCQTVDHLTAGQRFQRIKIHQHDLRLPEAPTMFFVSPRSIAVLPPMEESTCASTVVGQFTKSMPRI